MTYATLMVHLELGRPNAAVLNVASALARRFDAGVIGITACQPMPIVFADGAVDGSLVEQNRTELEREMQEAEAALRQALQAHRGLLGWRASIEFLPLADHIAREARAADLLVTGVATQAATAPATGDDATALYAFVQDQGADLVVAGAYGHSRLREWAFGGVTRDLLLRTDCCVLLSH